LQLESNLTRDKLSLKQNGSGYSGSLTTAKAHSWIPCKSMALCRRSNSASPPQGSQGHWYASDSSGNHQGTEAPEPSCCGRQAGFAYKRRIATIQTFARLRSRTCRSWHHGFVEDASRRDCYRKGRLRTVIDGVADAANGLIEALQRQSSQKVELQNKSQARGSEQRRYRRSSRSSNTKDGRTIPSNRRAKASRTVTEQVIVPVQTNQ
jgi:hypothetical protein